MTTYEIDGNQIIRVFHASEKEIAAVCDQPEKALKMMLRAWKLNDDRKYTASARLLAELETLPGFKWTELQ